MRRIEPYTLWIGHAGDLADIKAIREQAFVAVVDLAINEPPRMHARETAYLRFPLHDGAGNSDAMLSAAITSVAQFVKQSEPILVCCSAGMSRSVAVAAAVLALLKRTPFDDALEAIARAGPADVSFDLKKHVSDVLDDLRRP